MVGMQVLVPEELSEDGLRKKLIGTKILEEGDLDKAKGAMKRTRAGESISDNAIKWEDEEAALAAINALRSTDTMVDYAAFGYSDDLSVLRILGAGKGGVEAVRTHFKEDECVFVVMSAVVPDGNYSVQKNILISWVGQRVAPLHRSRSAQNRVELYQLASKLIQVMNMSRGHLPCSSSGAIHSFHLTICFSGTATRRDSSAGVRGDLRRSGDAETFWIQVRCRRRIRGSGRSAQDEIADWHGGRVLL